MKTTTLDNSRISKHLGQTSEYKDQYDPGLLVSEPRSNNRKHLNISDDDLPFVGYDTWNAYEVSALTNNGMPVAGVAKVVYPSNSKFIVEEDLFNKRIEHLNNKTYLEINENTIKYLS